MAKNVGALPPETQPGLCPGLARVFDCGLVSRERLRGADSPPKILVEEVTENSLHSHKNIF